ncbi:hypothetical protein ABMY35_20400 [Pseudoalteromonas sp. BZB3]
MRTIEKELYQLSADDICVYAVVKGSWSYDEAILFSKDFLDIIKTFEGKPFTHLVYFDGFTFSVPEIEEIIQKLVDKLVSQGLRFTAQVIPFEYYNITQFQLAKMTQTKGLFVKKSFNCLIDAQDWLESQSFNMPHQDNHFECEIFKSLKTG